MNTDHLSEFLVLAKVLSFTRAAQILYTSQSVLSRHIKALEEDLGVKLLVRDSHGVSLTEAGKRLAGEGGHILEGVDITLGILKASTPPSRGIVRLGCSVEISYANHLRTFLRTFAQRFPDIELSVTVLTESMSEDNVRDYDILLSPCDYPSGMERTMINNHGTYAVLPFDSRLISKSLLALHQLAGETIIVPFAGEFFGPYAKNWLLAERRTGGSVTQLRAPNLLTALLLSNAGRGIVVAPRYVKNMVPPDTFVIGISDAACRFPEYIYLNPETENHAAKLFYEEYCQVNLHNLPPRGQLP